MLSQLFTDPKFLFSCFHSLQNLILLLSLSTGCFSVLDILVGLSIGPVLHDLPLFLHRVDTVCTLVTWPAFLVYPRTCRWRKSLTLLPNCRCHHLLHSNLLRGSWRTKNPSIVLIKRDLLMTAISYSKICALS